MTLRITYALALVSSALEAAAQTQVQFNQVVNLNGDVRAHWMVVVCILISMLR